MFYSWNGRLSPCTGYLMFTLKKIGVWLKIKAVQQHLSMFRKAAINIIKLFKERTKTKRAISNIMLDCLIDLIVL